MRSVAVTFTAGSGSRRFELREDQQISIGRSRRADLHVNSPRLSRIHCGVSFRDKGVVLEDLGSSNGTFVNGQRAKTVVLRPGDIIQLGVFDFIERNRFPGQSPAFCGALLDIALCRQVFTIWPTKN